MQNWETHNLAPAGALKSGTTHIDVYANNDKPVSIDKKKTEGWDKRMDELKPPNYPPIDKKTREWEHRHEAYKQRLRNDPEYQFLMKVAAFANIKLENMWNTPSEEPGRSAVSTGGGLGNIVAPNSNPLDTSSTEASFQHQWTTIPEVSGLVYLNPTIFGHLHEAYEMIGPTMPMEELMISLASTLFARLVALRIKMSAFLSGLNYNLDRNYQRLIQQQTLCLRALRKKVRGQGRDNGHTFMLKPSDYKTIARNKRVFNNTLGRYTNKTVY